MNDLLTIICADALTELRKLPRESVHCIVTSPPYWGLRDYGTASWEGGNESHEHDKVAARNGRGGSGSPGKQTDGAFPSEFSAKDCKCGARRIDAQLGLEKTPEEYVAKLVEVFREVRRVMRHDATLWLNLGSSYASGDMRPNRSRSDVPACDSDGTVPPNSLGTDSVYSGLCDGCRAATENRSRRKSGNDQSIERSVRPDHETNRDKDPVLESYLNEASGALASTNPESFLQLPALCSHCANCGACLNVLASASRDYRLCARRASSRPDKGETEQTWRSRMTDMVLSSSAWRYLTTESLKAKDDSAIPWLLCLALRMDGWYSRCPIIWKKPNPMPESTTDRPTKSHEYIFLLTKSGATTYWTHRDKGGSRTKPPPDYEWSNRATGERTRTEPFGWEEDENWSRRNMWRAHDYFYDAEAIKERSEYPDDDRKARSDNEQKRMPTEMVAGVRPGSATYPNRNKRSVWTVATAPFTSAAFGGKNRKLSKDCPIHGYRAVRERAQSSGEQQAASRTDHKIDKCTCVQYGDEIDELQDHFAVFPPDLIKPCILAGTSAKGCCAKCGAPWERIVENTPMVIDRSERTHELGRTRSSGTMLEPAIVKTIGWQPTCICYRGDSSTRLHDRPVVPCTVLDPFAGSFTTCAAALELGRRAIGIELSPKYCDMGRDRCNVTPGLQLA